MPQPSTPPVIMPTCHDWMFKCGNNRCVPYWWKCDGINDCGDGSDELGCPNSTESTSPPPGTGIIAPEISCTGNRFACNSGRCIERTYVCDGFPDCSNGEDEKNCPKNVCGKEKFRCHSDNLCLDITKYCDGVVNCVDGSDEKDCKKDKDPKTDNSK